MHKLLYQPVTDSVLNIVLESLLDTCQEIFNVTKKNEKYWPKYVDFIILRDVVLKPELIIRILSYRNRITYDIVKKLLLTMHDDSELNTHIDSQLFLSIPLPHRQIVTPLSFLNITKISNYGMLAPALQIIFLVLQQTFISILSFTTPLPLSVAVLLEDILRFNCLNNKPTNLLITTLKHYILFQSVQNDEASKWGAFVQLFFKDFLSQDLIASLGIGDFFFIFSFQISFSIINMLSNVILSRLPPKASTSPKRVMELFMGMFFRGQKNVDYVSQLILTSADSAYDIEKLFTIFRVNSIPITNTTQFLFLELLSHLKIDIVNENDTKGSSTSTKDIVLSLFRLLHAFSLENISQVATYNVATLDSTNDITISFSDNVMRLTDINDIPFHSTEISDEANAVS